MRNSDSLPLIVRADKVHGITDEEVTAEGHAELRKHSLRIAADILNYKLVSDLATAKGNVRLVRDGNVYTGPELQLRTESGEGFFLKPSYVFARTGGSGSAQRVDFIDKQRAVSRNATYSTCKCDNAGDEPDWKLSAEEIRTDLSDDTGEARNVKLTFFGVPVFASPYLSFPLSDARKTGLLPPQIALSSRTGFEFTQPWYWNIAPNRDYTFSPTFISRRGVNLGNEFRYLEPSFSGQLRLDYLPEDESRGGDKRWGAAIRHNGTLLGGAFSYSANAARVSDDEYWKDFPRSISEFTQRLLPSDLLATYSLQYGFLQSRWLQYQVLQDPLAPIVQPYALKPQVLLRQQRFDVAGFDVGADFQWTQFAHPTLITGRRTTLSPYVSYPIQAPGYYLLPRLSARTTRYALDQPLADGRRQVQVNVPTLSLDGGLVFDRRVDWFERRFVQTLEPRVFYVRTPFKDQAGLPLFDTALLEPNFASFFSENAFAGGDRVSDENTLTLGGATRFLDEDSGTERFRFQYAQRVRLSDQRTTLTGTSTTETLSDALFGVAWAPNPRVAMDATVQYDPEQSRSVRSVLGARYTPAPFKTVYLAYRWNRGIAFDRSDRSEQYDLAWQWPLAFASLPRLYTVGRVNYSKTERRVTEAIGGLEYEQDCWLFRFVTQRISTDRASANTKFFLQLEFTGLTRLGNNPLSVLKQSIPQYRVLKEGSDKPNPYANYE
jgi:LPS-assembly protein